MLKCGWKCYVLHNGGISACWFQISKETTNLSNASYSKMAKNVKNPNNCLCSNHYNMRCIIITGFRFDYKTLYYGVLNKTAALNSIVKQCFLSKMAKSMACPFHISEEKNNLSNTSCQNTIKIHQVLCKDRYNILCIIISNDDSWHH